jgi:RimJ/RimL family protein N-acetyltransferase
MQCPFLIGSTIYLRPLELADGPTITPWLNDPETARFLRRHRPISLIQEEEYLKHVATSEQDLALGIVLRDGDRLIGATGFHDVEPRNRSASFGIVLGDKTTWGKGHGTEATRLIVGYAFETMNLNRVWLHVYEYNPRALRVYEKVGFRQEGRLRQDTYRDGRYWDTIVMGILREEWR